MVVSKTPSVWYIHARGRVHLHARPNLLRNLCHSLHVCGDIFTLRKGRTSRPKHHFYNASSRSSISMVAFACRRFVMGVELSPTPTFHCLHCVGDCSSHEHQGRERFVRSKPAQHWKKYRRGVIKRFLRGHRQRIQQPLSPFFG